MKTSVRIVFGCVAFLSLASVAMANLEVSESDLKKAALTQAIPDYPTAAKQFKITGRVVLSVSVTKDGAVESVQAVSGNPMLSQAAVAAMKRWKFTPFVANGVAQPAKGQISFDFR